MELILSILGILMGAGIAAVFIVPALLWRGYVLSVAWGWLVVPLFGLAPLTIPAALTISTLMAFLTMQTYTGPDDPAKSGWLARIEIIFLNPLIMLAVCFVIKQFI